MAEQEVSVKKAVAVRMPDWPKGQWPTSAQLEIYIYFWYHQRPPLAADPGTGNCQKSFWLDPEDLDREARSAGCVRSGRPDRALFVRRIIATYHKRRFSKPMPTPVLATPPLAAEIASKGIATTVPQVLPRVAAPAASSRGSELSPAQVNEISRRQGLVRRETPRLCRGGSRSLTDPGVHRGNSQT